MKVIKESENCYDKLHNELNEILPNEQSRNIWGVKYNWILWWGYSYNLVVDLYRPEYEEQFKKVCKKYNVDILYIDDER
jgi:hypothetical protein